MIWHLEVSARLRESGLFRHVGVTGAKVRAVVDDARFLERFLSP